MSASIEIRVHVSGPSRGLDDARYRNEARAVSAFESAGRVDILNQHDLNINRNTDSSSPLFSSHSNNHSDTLTTSDSIGPTQRVEAIRGLFTSRLQSETPKASPVRYTALRTPAAAKLASPVLPWTSIKETPHLLVKGTPFPPRPQSAPGTPSNPRKVLARSQSDSWETPPSVVPDSQERVLHQVQVPDSGLKRQLPQSSASNTPDPSPTRKRPRTHASSSPAAASLQTQIELLQTQEIGHSTATQSQNGDQTQATQGSGGQQVIWPKRGPVVGNHKFETHMTPRLLKLASAPNVKLLNIQCPTVRPIGRMERGYWRVDIVTWDEAHKGKLWTTLDDWITRGKAGWGVWCARGLDSNGNRNQAEGDAGVKKEDVVKLWCFGEVIREIFLVLYIGGVNRKENPGSLAEWIDSNGDVVATATGRYLND